MYGNNFVPTMCLAAEAGDFLRHVDSGPNVYILTNADRNERF